MATNTTQYNFQKPEVGADTDAWGDMLNGNWDKTENILTGVTPILKITAAAASASDVVATFSGKVGIGTTTPSAVLDVTVGNIVAGGKGVEISGNTSYIADGSYGTSLDITHNYQSNDGSFRAINIDLTDSGTNNQALYGLYVNAEYNYLSGNVGIGTTSPTSTLHVKAATADLNIQSNDGQSATLTFGDVTDTNRGVIEYTSTDDLVFSNNNLQERMRIRYTGNVGIGTTNPSAKLHVEINDNTAYSSANMLNGTIAQYIFNTSDTDGTHAVLGFGVDGTSTDAQAAIGATYTDAGDGALVMGTRAGGNVTERMRIDSSGNVGIGTDSPASKLHVQDSTGSPQIRIDNQGTGSGIASLMFHGGGTGNPTSIIQSGGTDSGNVGIIFKHGNHGSETERMRITSSGNLLVGKQAVEMAAVGVEVKPAGEVRITSDDVFGLQLNRKTGDGEIINLRKDGSPVGSIGTETGRLTIGSGDTGLRFLGDTDEITPWNTSTNAGRDALIDLGNANNRFKDLYLSGAGYFGGNVGIGTTSPSAKLHTVGDDSNGTTLATSATNAKVRHENHSASSLSSFQGYTGNSWYTQIANNSGTTSYDLSLNPYGGNVGIGTTSPTEKLHIVGGDLGIGSTQYRENNVVSYASADYSIATSGAYNLTLKTNDTERMRIDSSGNVLVGKTSADNTTQGIRMLGSAGFASFVRDGAEPIVVNRLTNDGDLVEFRKDGTTVGSIGTDYSGITFASGGSTERMRIDSSGNVTVGTNSKSSATTLKVENASGYAPSLEFNQSGVGAATISIPVNTNALQFNRYNGGTLNESMRIDSSGNLLVGTTSPFGGATDDRVTVKNTNLSTGGIRIGNTDGSGNTTCLRFHNSNGIVGSVVTNGSATSFNTSSDERLKENIADSADAGSKVDAIQIRQFDWKSDGSHQDYGVIAQELVTVAPEAVHQPEDSEEMMGVDYSKLVPMLIKEVQSLRSRVAELENA